MEQGQQLCKGRCGSASLAVGAGAPLQLVAASELGGQWDLSSWDGSRERLKRVVCELPTVGPGVVLAQLLPGPVGAGWVLAIKALSPLADLDGHSDPEESFARDLPDFPSINPEATCIDDEDDTSIGIPSLAYRAQGTEDLQLPYEQEEFGTLPSVQNLTNNITGFVTRGMIQLALSGAPQPGSSRSTNPQRGAKTHLRAASSDLDTDAEGDDFELLDQSELNQLDPTGSRGQ